MMHDGKDSDGRRGELGALEADSMLEQLFAEARATPADPRPEFLERIMADAAAMQPQADVVEPVRDRPAKNLLLRVGAAAARRWEALVWPVGLAATALSGVWLGGWADLNGFVSGSGFAGSDLAMSLAYGFPQAAGLIGGY